MLELIGSWESLVSEAKPWGLRWCRRQTKLKSPSQKWKGMGTKPLGVLLKGKGFGTRVERRMLKSQVTHSHSRSDRSVKREKMESGREIRGEGGDRDGWQAPRMDVLCAAEQNMELNDTVQPSTPGSLHTKHLYYMMWGRAMGSLIRWMRKDFGCVGCHCLSGIMN